MLNSRQERARRERQATVGAICLLVLIVFACVTGVTEFKQGIRNEDTCLDLVDSLQYSVVDGNLYCFDYDTSQYIGVTQ